MLPKSKAFFIPLAIETHGLIMNWENTYFSWLLQAGGVLLTTFDLEKGFSSIVQTGLKYNFSREFYGAFRGGAIHMLAVDRIWKSGIFFGYEKSILKLEVGIQYFYLGDVDQVFPHKPLRQWVLSFPFPLRLLFAKDPKLMGTILNLVHRSISTYLTKKAGLKKKYGATTGSVTFIQCFRGSLNLNIHFISCIRMEFRHLNRKNLTFISYPLLLS